MVLRHLLLTIARAPRGTVLAAFALSLALTTDAAHAQEESVINAEQIAVALTAQTRGIGVAERPTISLRVPFEINSARLRPEATVQLDELAAALGSELLARRRFDVIGHTDSNGSADYNRRLSMMRADAVCKYLVSRHAIDNGRLSPLGRGEEQPLPGTDPRAPENRRVEIALQESNLTSGEETQ
jgi:outer membrane protein OmpA-like peptidoglycan-associated protein